MSVLQPLGLPGVGAITWGAVDFQLSPAELAFKDEVRTWLEEHMVGEFAALRGRGGMGQEDIPFATLLDWERELAKGGGPNLRRDLATVRESIDHYYGDLGQYPDALPALVDKHYIRSVPVDPFTKSAESWLVVESDDPDHPGVRDIHSGSPESGADGSPFVSW